MIVRNEADHLAQCLRDIQPAVDEIIVVDTGSEDRTRDVAAACGARVFDFAWCDDFSAARNASLEKASGDYILWLDADDRMDPADVQTLCRLKAGLPPAKDRAYYLIVRDESPVRGSTDFTQLRLFPNLPAARFEWRIHEQISRNLLAAGVTLTRAEITIRHTGNHDPDSVRRKSERNLAIIEKELAGAPGERVLRFHAARTLANLDRLSEAVEHMEIILRDPEEEKRRSQLWVESGLLAARYLNELQQYVRAENLLRVLGEVIPDHLLLHLSLGESLLRQERFGEAMLELTASLERPLEIGIFPVNPAQIQFQQYFYLGSAYGKLGDSDKALAMLRESLNVAYDKVLSLQELALFCLKNEKFPEAAQYYEQLLSLPGQQAEGHYSNLGLVYRKLGRPAQAELAYLKALGINPERIEPLANLGHLYLERKDYQRALNCFTQVLRLDPNLTDIKLCLCEIYYRFQDLDNLVRQCDSLLQDLDLPRARTLDGYADLAELLDAVGEALSHLGRFDLALLAFRLALLIHPLPNLLKKMLTLAASCGRLADGRGFSKDVLEHYARDGAVLSALRAEVEQVAAAY